MKARHALAGVSALLAAGSHGLGALGAPLSMRQKIYNVTNAVARGQIVGPRPDIEVVRFPIYHRLDLETDTGTELEFFGVSPQQHVCNMPAGANGLPNNYGYVCTHVGFTIQHGYAVDGTAVAAAEGYAASDDPLEIANDLRNIYANGLVRVDFDNREILHVYGTGRLALGSGANVQAVSEGNAAAVSFVNVTNGLAHDDNGFELRSWAILRESQPVRARIKWNFTRTLKANYVAMLVLDGMLIRPR